MPKINVNNLRQAALKVTLPKTNVKNLRLTIRLRKSEGCHHIQNGKKTISGWYDSQSQAHLIVGERRRELNND